MDEDHVPETVAFLDVVAGAKEFQFGNVWRVSHADDGWSVDDVSGHVRQRVERSVELIEHGGD